VTNCRYLLSPLAQCRPESPIGLHATARRFDEYRASRSPDDDICPRLWRWGRFPLSAPSCNDRLFLRLAGRTQAATSTRFRTVPERRASSGMHPVT
jgi:hypothetical protein